MERGEDRRLLGACGLSGLLRLGFEGVEGGAGWEFPRPFAVAGRDPGVDLVVDHPDVSRRHAYFQAIGGRVFCIDLASRTGLGTDGGRIRSGWVDGRAGLRLGPARVLALDGPDHGGGPAAASDPLRTRVAGNLPRLAAAMPAEPGRPAWRLGRVLTLVGRSEGCRIRLTDPSVSKVHCSLLRTREGIWALDLLGRGGIEFNGRRVRWARMGPGDRLRVGRYAIEIRRLSEATGVDPSASGVFAVPPLPPRCPASASEAEPAGPVMARVVDQIGLMQREMSDRFQHAMLGMAEIFGDLQRDRMDLVDGELDRLRRLDRDLHVLQARIDPGARAAPPSTTSVPC